MVRTELVIASGETEIVASGETQDTATVSNAGTFENAGTNTAGGQELTATGIDIDIGTTDIFAGHFLSGTATDIDASSATLTRVRTLTTIGLPTLNISQGDTEAVDANTTETSGEVKNAGTLANSGTFKTGVEGPTAVDIDESDIALNRTRQLTSSGVDIDASTTTLTRIRELDATATDIDAITALLERIRELDATAADRDTATSPLFILVAVRSERAVATVKEILERTDDNRWAIEPPTVLNYWDRTQQERGPGADQAAEIYLWEPAGKDIERFSLDNTSTRDTASVEALVYSLDEQDVIDYAEQVRQILQQYFDVNKDPTAWQTIEVTSVNDLREQTQRRNTDQYVVSLEIELVKLNNV